MEKRYLIFGGGIFLIALIIGIWVFTAEAEIPQDIIEEIEKSENSIVQVGIVSSIENHPKYENLELSVYYKYSYCKEKIKENIDKFEGRINLKRIKKLKSEDGKELLKIGIGNLKNAGFDLPLVVLEGNAQIFNNELNEIEKEENYETIISGVNACSDDILISSLCKYLKNAPKLCTNYIFNEEKVDVGSQESGASHCNNKCNIEFELNGKLIRAYMRSQNCGLIDSYIKGQSKLIKNQCYGKNSCESDSEDISCCFEWQCSYNGMCYHSDIAIDVDSDGQKEVCYPINDKGFWVNADQEKKTCDNNFKWLSCQKGECKFGIDNYDIKENGLCCGDDENEEAVECTGKICDVDEDFACCEPGSCVYNGKCYDGGCKKLKLNNAEKTIAYCENGKWSDLDDSFCVKCLGEKAWSGLVCCGDDEFEGKYPNRFIYHTENGTKTLPMDYCVKEKNNCRFPGADSDLAEGCYIFHRNRYLSGGYYCSKNEWYDFDNSSYFCEECDYNWLEGCCGDDKDEHYIIGDDKTKACCESESDIVVDGKCYPTAVCGNKIVNDGEDCELPNSNDNYACRQATEMCINSKFGTRDMYGKCGQECLCEEDRFNLECVQGKCGAECSVDSDCESGEICDQINCICRTGSYCGDGIVQDINDADWSEECEYPLTLFNPSCNNTLRCFGDKTGIRYQKGGCDKNCQCTYTSYQRICIKGSCGAECNQDGSGCEYGHICDTSTCGCIKSNVICGDGYCESGEEITCMKDCIDEECPYKIDIEFDKNNYNENDSMLITVKVHNKNNELMSNIEFDLEFFVNYNHISTFTHKIPENGVYQVGRRIRNILGGGNYEQILYIAKTKSLNCDVVADSESTLTYTTPNIPKQNNVSYYEVVGYEWAKFVSNSFYSISTPFVAMTAPIAYSVNASDSEVEVPSLAVVCGNGIVETGELCEGVGVCRPSFGCDYGTRTYDIPEVCNACSCFPDLESETDDEVYCNNCPGHCGDGVLNCDEECESGVKYESNVCTRGKIYNRTDICYNCMWYDDGPSNDVLVDDCYCECPESPGECIDGNWIDYEESYYAGCAGSYCYPCVCEDKYTKDSDGDGIEDKCSPEICDNEVDDNDDGLIDMKDPECSICNNCGLGSSNFCDREECIEFEQNCYFNNIFFGLGSCNNCTLYTYCEDYGFDKVSCINDTCNIGYCLWEDNSCCTDVDGDKVCDDNDNCLGVFNPEQENTDGDELGDLCEVCDFESKLFHPLGDKEKSCNDGIDEDCDGQMDCEDEDCIGLEGCCRLDSDCVQSNCIIEVCDGNICNYKNRFLCDDTECPEDQYCDFSGNCSNPEISEEVCLLCAEDLTKDDSGIGFGFNLFKQIFHRKPYCCGNQENEFYFYQGENGKAACCDEATDCIDNLGNCADSNTPDIEGHQSHCFENKWYECNTEAHIACSALGQAGNKIWYCTNDGFIWSWRTEMPDEICSDAIDNDCDSLVDHNDTDCIELGSIKWEG